MRIFRIALYVSHTSVGKIDISIWKTNVLFIGNSEVLMIYKGYRVFWDKYLKKLRYKSGIKNTCSRLISQDLIILTGLRIVDVMLIKLKKAFIASKYLVSCSLWTVAPQLGVAEMLHRCIVRPLKYCFVGMSLAEAPLAGTSVTETGNPKILSEKKSPRP